ncbi:hypothetical protein B0H16DRAFT_1602626 [Mycena metata]|uniref:Uncharacterized protein n=1 Tax=Mycena metata TaxID=1033252 RepID=A0AAD7HJN2_9AGAR|nr:hypothetical protein B0H16DRAFT_1602626 [Mycena metata]
MRESFCGERVRSRPRMKASKRDWGVDNFGSSSSMDPMVPVKDDMEETDSSPGCSESSSNPNVERAGVARALQLALSVTTSLLGVALALAGAGPPRIVSVLNLSLRIELTRRGGRGRCGHRVDASKRGVPPLRRDRDLGFGESAPATPGT